MTNEILLEIACPNCRNPINILDNHDNHIQCDACSSRFILDGHICAQCSTFHPQSQNFCRQCGAPLSRVCRKCQHTNWIGDEYCQNCGSAIDILELLHLQHQTKAAGTQQARIETIRQIKQKEEESAQKRMAHFEALEAERLTQLEANRKQARKQDMILFGTVGAVLVGFILLLLIWLLLIG